MDSQDLGSRRMPRGEAVLGLVVRRDARRRLRGAAGAPYHGGEQCTCGRMSAMAQSAHGRTVPAAAASATTAATLRKAFR
jgi:hypothetical protein